MWQKLSAVLKEITGYYEMLYTLNIKKRSVLVDINMELLEKIVKKEKEIADHISAAEERRQGIMLDLSAVCGGVKPGMKRFELYQYIPEKYKDEIIERDDALDKIVKKVMELAENNTLLITSALSAVNFRLNQIGGSMVEPAYGQKGQEIVTKQKRFDYEA